MPLGLSYSGWQRETGPCARIWNNSNSASPCWITCGGATGRRGGDLIRLVELSLDLSFRESLAHLERQPAPVPEAAPLEQAALFYQSQLPRHPEARQYLWQRGLRQPDLIQQLGIGAL